jgi:hypothetical protein
VIVFAPVALIAALVSQSTTGALVAALLGLVASAWYGGLVVRTVQDVHDGKADASIRELFASVTGVILPLILVGLVDGIAIVIGLALLIVPGLIILTVWAVAAPVVVVENPGVFAALSRSRELVRGNGWEVFTLILSLFAIKIVLGFALGAVAHAFAAFFLVQLLLNVLLAPFYALAAAVLYIALCSAHGQEPPARPGAPASATT